MVRRGSPFRVGHFSLDAVIRAKDGAYSGAKLLAAVARNTIRPRVEDAFLHELAASRAFTAFLIITQDRGDASELANACRCVGECGIAVLWFNPSIAELVTEVSAERITPPDLAKTHAELLKHWLGPTGAGDLERTVDPAETE